MEAYPRRMGARGPIVRLPAALMARVRLALLEVLDLAES
jgi:hypothetical protein